MRSATPFAAATPPARHPGDRLFTLAVWTAAASVAAVFAWLLLDLAAAGAARLSWSFLFTAPENAGRSGGIGPILVSTLLILAVAIAVALPPGLGTAIWLADYARTGSHAASAWRWTCSRACPRSCSASSATPSSASGWGWAFPTRRAG